MASFSVTAVAFKIKIEVVVSLENRITARIEKVHAWHEVAKGLAVEQLRLQHNKMCEEIRSQCTHRFTPWRETDEEMYIGWIKYWKKSCEICGLSRRVDVKPDEEIAPGIRTLSNPL